MEDSRRSTTGVQDKCESTPSAFEDIPKARRGFTFASDFDPVFLQEPLGAKHHVLSGRNCCSPAVWGSLGQNSRNAPARNCKELKFTQRKVPPKDPGLLLALLGRLGCTVVAKCAQSSAGAAFWTQGGRICTACRDPGCEAAFGSRRSRTSPNTSAVSSHKIQADSLPSTSF